LLSPSNGLRLISYSHDHDLQLCVWDWLLSLSDEFEMILHGEQYRRYLYDTLYLVVR
jgi:hypothetical protein